MEGQELFKAVEAAITEVSKNKDSLEKAKQSLMDAQKAYDESVAKASALRSDVNIYFDSKFSVHNLGRANLRVANG